MRRILIIVLCLLFSGCAATKSVEAEKRVKTLGVLPVLIDEETIDYSNSDGLVALLEESSQGVDEWLIDGLRKKGDYFDVRRIDLPPAQLYGQIVSGRNVVGEDAASHHTYSFDPAGVTALVDDHLVDAVLVVVVNGIKRHEKRWSPHSTRFEYLETDYRSLLYSAAVVAAPAEILWDRKPPAGDFFLRLDYPDFSEAFWNLTDEVHVKEISLPGLERRLAERDEGMFIKTTTPKVYDDLVRELVGALKKSM